MAFRLSNPTARAMREEISSPITMNTNICATYAVSYPHGVDPNNLGMAMNTSMSGGYSVTGKTPEKIVSAFT